LHATTALLCVSVLDDFCHNSVRKLLAISENETKLLIFVDIQKLSK